MKTSNPIRIFCDDKNLLDLLMQSMDIEVAKGADIVIEVEQSSVSVNSKLFRNPIRIVEIVDYIKSLKSEEGLKIGDIEYFYTRKEVKFGGEEIILTEKENDLFSHLVNAKGEVSTEEILKSIWNYNSDVETTTLDTHLYRLRQKLDSIGLGDIIVTTEGGYQFKQNK